MYDEGEQLLKTHFQILYQSKNVSLEILSKKYYVGLSRISHLS